MKLVLYVLSEKKYLEPFLHELKLNDINGATIINSKNMIKTFGDSRKSESMKTLKSIMENTKTESHVILMVLNDDLVEKVYEIINNLSKDLNVKNLGVIYLLPVNSMEGSKL